MNKAGRKKTENKAVPRTGQYSEYIQELNDAWRFFAIHDYVAKQQAIAFHQQRFIIHLSLANRGDSVAARGWFDHLLRV